MTKEIEPLREPEHKFFKDITLDGVPLRGL